MASQSELRMAMALTMLGTFGLFVLFVILFSAVLSLFTFCLSAVCGVFILMLLPVIIVIQVIISPWAVRKATRTRILEKGENKHLEDVVRELTKKAQIPMPKLGIVESDFPNAFVYGRSQSSTVLVVHSGLLKKLNKDELRAVLAHEVGHIVNRDVFTMTVLSVMPLMAGKISEIAFHMDADNIKFFVMKTAIAGLGFAMHWLMSLMIKRLSRLREYYADAYAALITEPKHLISALSKITYGLSYAPPEGENMAVRSFYIHDAKAAQMDMEALGELSKYDLNKDGVLDEHELELAMSDEANIDHRKLEGLMASHPPTYRRILNLKALEKDLKGGGFERDKYDETRIYEKVEF